MRKVSRGPSCSKHSSWLARLRLTLTRPCRKQHVRRRVLNKTALHSGVAKHASAQKVVFCCPNMHPSLCFGRRYADASREGCKGSPSQTLPLDVSTKYLRMSARATSRAQLFASASSLQMFHRTVCMCRFTDPRHAEVLTFSNLSAGIQCLPSKLIGGASLPSAYCAQVQFEAPPVLIFKASVSVTSIARKPSRVVKYSPVTTKASAILCCADASRALRRFLYSPQRLDNLSTYSWPTYHWTVLHTALRVSGSNSCDIAYEPRSLVLTNSSETFAANCPDNRRLQA
mmetsp:Transcript_111159/g.321318  ORF Transcript_111159/g.321318 Transcript_111159/m.321318 type:complete len:286 (+) Transcript_111159:846-1703(+)